MSGPYTQDWCLESGYWNGKMPAEILGTWWREMTCSWRTIKTVTSHIGRGCDILQGGELGFDSWLVSRRGEMGGSSMCLFLHGKIFLLCFPTAYQILFEMTHWTWDSRCLITHLIGLSRPLVMQPSASSSHHFWSEVKTHLHMPKNTAIIGTLDKEIWKQSRATHFGLCTPKELLKSCGTVCQSRSLQRQYRQSSWCAGMACLFLHTAVDVISSASSHALSVLKWAFHSGGVHKSCKSWKTETNATMKRILPPLGCSGYLQRNTSRCLPTSDTWRGLDQRQQFFIIYGLHWLLLWMHRHLCKLNTIKWDGKAGFLIALSDRLKGDKFKKGMCKGKRMKK